MALTVHDLGAPRLLDDSRRTRRGRWQMLAVLLLCAAPVIASYFMYFVVRPEGRTNYGTLISPGRDMPDLGLVDLAGQSVKPRDLKHQWLLVVVSPSNCDAACEKRLYMQRQLREMLGRERERLDKIWLITDREPLRADLQAAVTATPPATVLRADAAAVAAWLQPEAGRKLEEHLYIVDPMGLWMMRVPADPEPQRVKRDLDRLMRASGSWDQPGR